MNAPYAPVNSISRKRALKGWRDSPFSQARPMSCTAPTQPLEKPKPTRRDLWAWRLILAIAISWVVLGFTAWLITR